MHDIRLIRDNPAAFDAGLESRGLGPLSATLVAMDDRRRAAISALQVAQERRNALSKEIGQAKKARDEARAEGLMAEVARIKEDVPALEAEEREAKAALDEALAEIPNMPKADVPHGSDEHGNVVRHEWGEPVALADAKQHFELGEAWTVGGRALMDFEAAGKLAGSRFVVLRGQLARLERALGQFMLDLHTTEHGYTEVSPPLLVNNDVMFGTAQLPKFKEDQFVATNLLHQALDAIEHSLDKDQAMFAAHDSMVQMLDVLNTEFKISNDGVAHSLRERMAKAKAEAEEGMISLRAQTKSILAERWLIPTAEVPLTNLVRESILSEEELPLRMTALTPCFRAEAGAAGRDTRGMLRQHQFIKCELVSITTPETSEAEHERMLACAEAVLKALELPYRVMTLCTGDMGFASQKTYDIEVWVPGQGTFREISSCSVCGDFQARRMDARYRPKGEKSVRHVHTLNGSGVAVGRALIAVLENYQQPDGSVVVPSALRPYMGGLERIGA